MNRTERRLPRVERFRISPELEISRLVTGLWQIAEVEREGVDLDEGASAMGDYVDSGATTFDMADHYGSAELIAGRFESLRRGEAEFLTKWVPKPGPAGPGDAEAAVRRALEGLRRDRIDLLQYHAWRYDDPAWLDHLFQLERCREQGLIGRLGVTNVDAPHLRMLLESGIGIATNQVAYSLLDRRAQGEMTEICRLYRVKLLAYGVLAGGLLTGRAARLSDVPPDEMPTRSLMKYRRFVDAAGGWTRYRAAVDRLLRVAERLGTDPALVSLRYVLDSPEVAAVVVGSRLDARSLDRANQRVFDLRLSAEDRAELEEAFDELDRIPGGCGDEYRRPPFLTAAGDLSDHFDELPAPYPLIDLSGRQMTSSGTRWEEMAGYGRAVRVGGRISVSGTTAAHGNRLIGGECAASQAHFCIDKIEGALRSLGGELRDVVRTRIFVADMARWEEIARVHGRRFGGIRPASTLVGADLVGEGYLVEMEAEAVLTGAIA